MSTVITGFSGQFSRNVLISTLLPAVAFVGLCQLFVVPLLPAGLHLLDPPAFLGALDVTITILLAGIVLSSLLYVFNRSIIRWYEGYPWKDWPFARRRRREYVARYNAAAARSRGMLALYRAMPVGDRRREVVVRRWRLARTVADSFAKDERLVLPTRLGNAIRAHEDYPRRRYGMDAITLWPRLISRIDDRYAGAIDEAKVPLDLAINSSLLGFVLAGLIWLAGLLNPGALGEARAFLGWLAEVVVFLGLAHGAYACSIGPAGAWGGMIEGAFDLYRWDLLKQLGYTHVPLTVAEERSVWSGISSQIQFGDLPEVPRIEYGPRPVVVTRDAREDIPGWIHVETSRSVTEVTADGSMTVSLSVRNVDPLHRVAPDVNVRDTLPEGFELEKDSATLSRSGRRGCTRYPASTRLEPIGENPHTFRIGDIADDELIVVTYRAKRRGK